MPLDHLQGLLVHAIALADILRSEIADAYVDTSQPEYQSHVNLATAQDAAQKFLRILHDDTPYELLAPRRHHQWNLYFSEALKASVTLASARRGLSEQLHLCQSYAGTWQTNFRAA